MSTTEATVMAAFIGVIGSLLVAALKTFFDWKNGKIRAKLNQDAQKQAHDQGLIAQEQAYNQRISEKMIDRVHEYAAKYYFPLLKRADDFNYYLIKVKKLIRMGKKVDDEIKKVSFFHFVMYIKAQHKLFNEVGGVLLNSFDLERKITELIHFFERKININLRDTNFLISTVKAVEYASFETELEKSHKKNNRLWKIYKKYKRNILNKKTREYLIKSLTAFYEIFLYGINMVFYPWYGEKPEPPVEGEQILKELGIPPDS